MHGVDADEPYINFHRPGLFAQPITDKKGKTRKRRLSAAGHHAGDLARNRHRDVGQHHHRPDESDAATAVSLHQQTIP